MNEEVLLSALAFDDDIKPKIIDKSPFLIAKTLRDRRILDKSALVKSAWPPDKDPGVQVVHKKKENVGSAWQIGSKRTIVGTAFLVYAACKIKN